MIGGDSFTRALADTWRLSASEYEEARRSYGQDITESWNRAGARGFPPATLPSIYELIAMAERAGYELPRQAKQVLATSFHQLIVEAALREGKPVPSYNIASYNLPASA